MSKKSVDCADLALRKVNITGNVIGKFGIFEIEQTFYNNTNKVLEVGYTFPIVDTATVTGFEVIVGDRILSGKCKETTQAKKEYQKNIVKGNSAYIMEQEAGNAFSISIGKLNKREEVKIKIIYIDKFEIIDNQIQILIPTLIFPRYNSEVTEKLKYGDVAYTADFNINIPNNLKYSKIESPTNGLYIIEEDCSKKIVIQNYELSQDFKLYINLENELFSNALISNTQENQKALYLSFMPEINDTYQDNEKEYVFIIDVSGSMDGEKLEETKHAVIECLNQLDEGDKFNIVQFSHEYVAMSLYPLEYNDDNLQNAINYVNKLEVNGATEILNPIKFALYEEDDEKIILLFTDGEVGNEDEIIAFVDKHINKSRIFPFGIDTSVNSYFINELAKAGNGKAELIQPNEKIDDKIIRTFARIQTPLLENIRVDYGNNKLVDEIKEDKALFNYEFFNVFAVTENLCDDITLKGNIAGKEYSWKINKEDIVNSSVDLEILFAKQQMDRLEKYRKNTETEDKAQNYKEMIIELSEKYNIQSKYTSFFTVYERENKILELPKYQETTLNTPKFGKMVYQLKNIFDFGNYNLFANDGFDAEGDYEECFEDDYAVRTTSLRYCLNRSPFCSNVDTEDAEKSREEILKEKVDEYYSNFTTNQNKSVKTYLLYGLLAVKSKDKNFDYESLLEFIEDHKEEILKNSKYQDIMYLIYKECNNEILIKYLDKDHKKLALTGILCNIRHDEFSEDELNNIVNGEEIEKYIDKALWYLCLNL